jgi:hypothetical protein
MAVDSITPTCNRIRVKFMVFFLESAGNGSPDSGYVTLAADVCERPSGVKAPSPMVQIYLNNAILKVHRRSRTSVEKVRKSVNAVEQRFSAHCFTDSPVRFFHSEMS